uniref:Oxidative stress-induced growth inhibitor 2-like n=1 Tax=Crassostrea virginica TaxID=6565 RepID=A0A8B8EHC5_CRAVI|nr:oxidative stress-induced growth inhibitor 2-like [Crassostrea virginica]XP_022339042.1 oxidative stress-induced growth inhibitor 2-like [Crassostrea virginica]XP_022339043.1 oxidative stress-induced growth inhibitor 2-like [Crassostrea virginica]
MPSSACSQYKDVVIVGNGPSAISLSVFLSGYRPYFKGGTHSNCYLNEKLQKMSPKKSIVEQDLSFLSEGLEGRSPNPVGLLFDTLSRPDADLGVENPSLLEWKFEKEHAIDHVVLGKGKAGGAWQSMDGSMQTLSFANWMELPSLCFKEWQNSHHRDESHANNGRATIADVRRYYGDFVEERGLGSYFRDQFVVTSVQKKFYTNKDVDSESGEVEPCKCKYKNHSFLWEVRGHCFHGDIDADREEFCYCTPNVVIATGTFDVPNKLSITGENLPYVLHSLQEVEHVLSNNKKKKSQDPVVIVGAGLSAADAIIMALKMKRPVVHVFRRGANDSQLIFKKLPAAIYPEYHNIHSMMKGKTINPLYKAYPNHSLVELRDDNHVLIQTTSGGDILSMDAFCVAILIGACPNLSFLPDNGKNLGIIPRCAIDSKHNPIHVDPYSYQCVAETGLYSMGPLVGDNFVRFGLGGSLGITNHLLLTKNKQIQ